MPRVSDRPTCGLLGTLLFGVVIGGCAGQGLVQEAAPERIEQWHAAQPDTMRGDAGSAFLVLGDTQDSWRVEHKFYRRAAWATWWQALVPFYQLYWLGNGVVGGINYLRHQPDLGAKPRAAVRTALHDAWAAPANLQPRFLLQLGDWVDDGRRPDHWTQFLGEYTAADEALLRTMPVRPTIGNHEYANDTTHGKPNFDALFDAARFYVIDLPHAAIFVLDSNRLVDMDQYLDADRQEALFRQWFVGDGAPSWLERELAKRADRPFKIVAMHHPVLTLAMHDKDWYNAANGRDLPAKRRALLDVLKDHGVQLVLSGHEHLYERNRLRYRQSESEQGEGERRLHQVISSGGGAVVRPETPADVRAERIARYREQGIAIEPILQRSVYHYSRVAATADSLRVTTFEVDIDVPQEVSTPLDEFTIDRSGRARAPTPPMRAPDDL